MEGIEKYPSSIRAGIKLLLHFLFINFIILALHILLQIVFTSAKKPDLKFGTYIYGTYYAISSLILYFYLNRRHNISCADIFRFSSFPFYILLTLIPILIGRHIIFTEILNIWDFFIPYTRNVNIFLPDMSFDYFLRAIFPFLLIPLFEEVLYRGIILEGFLSQYRPAKAILYSSLLFAFMHFGMFRFINTFATGLIFSYLYFKTRSLIPCILAHIFANALTELVFLLPEIPGLRNSLDPGHEFQPFWLTLTGIALFSVGLWIMVKYFNRLPSSSNELETIPKKTT